jgi:hypothetical protein
MPTYGQNFPSRYFKADDLSQPRVLRIAKCVTEKVGQDDKPVLYFDNEKKTLPLNKTNWQSVAEILDRDDDADWGGGVIELFAKTVPFKGDLVPAPRIRKPRPAKAARPSVPARAAAPVAVEEEDEPIDEYPATEEDGDDDEPPY